MASSLTASQYQLWNSENQWVFRVRRTGQYGRIPQKAGGDRLAVSGNPVVSSTVHVLSESEAVALLINNGEEETVVTPTIHPQWRAEKTSCSILPHDVCILRLKKS